MSGGLPSWVTTVPIADVPRLTRWRPGGPRVAAHTGCLGNHAYGGGVADGQLEIAEVAWLQVARITAEQHRVVHEPDSDATTSMAMALQIAGTSILEQQGRTARLTPGHWSVCNSGEIYTLASRGASQQLVLFIPGNRIERGIDLNAVVARSFSATSGVSRLAFGAAGWLIEELASIRRVRAEDLAESLCRLMNLAIYERTRQQPRQPAQRTLGDRIREYVAQHLHDPDLSLDSIARDLNASKRSLHRAIRDVDGSIHNLIWHARLERCREDLLDPAKAHQAITNIAQSWGFKNATHFSRAFRTRFGCSAREARRTAREALHRA